MKQLHDNFCKTKPSTFTYMYMYTYAYSHVSTHTNVDSIYIISYV